MKMYIKTLVSNINIVSENIINCSWPQLIPDKSALPLFSLV